MSIFSKSVMWGKRGINETRFSYSNYLDNPLFASYFNSKEKMAYYLSLKHVDKKRGFHKELINQLEEFLNQVSMQKAEDFLNEQIFSKKSSAEFTSTSPDVTEQFKKTNPKGFKLLEVEDPISFQSLKSSYRKAAFQHHPDRGGRHEDMLTINDAYQQFHNLLCLIQEGGVDNHEMGSDGYLNEAPQSARDYIYLIKILLAEVSLDDWNLEKAFDTFIQIEQEQVFQPHIERDRHRIYKFTEAITKRFLATELKGEASRSYELFTKVTNEMVAKGIGNPQYYRDNLEKIKMIRAGKKKPRFVFNHKRQAKNALRLGVIDKIKFEKLGGKYKEKADLYKEKEERLKKYINNVGFISELPYDVNANKDAPKKSLVPEPEYYGNNIYLLDDDQQAEYFIAFSCKTNLSLLNKYLFVRLDSLLKSVIRDFNITLLDQSMSELQFLMSLQDSKKSGVYYIEKIQGLFKYFRGLDEDGRRERLELLIKINDKFKGKLCAEPGNESLIDGLTRSFSQPRIDLLISTHLSFFDHAVSPLEHLRQLYETGVVSDKLVFNMDLMSY